MDRPIQVQFGAQVMDLFAHFARADLKSVADLESHEFSHVSDVRLRRVLAQVFYGARWMYKLGLALLTKDEERAAHIRCQIVDYSSVCEALLSYCAGHAIRSGQTRGEGFLWKNPTKRTGEIPWKPASIDRTLRDQSFWWFICISEEFGVISHALLTDLNWLRLQRNNVHIQERAVIGSQAYLNQSKRAFDLVMRTIDSTKKWKIEHP